VADVSVRLLTPTEERVAQLAADGRSDAQIAAELGVSIAIVAAHVSGACRKLGARSRCELAARLTSTPDFQEEP
jgi:DNA-binding CsgD family transcriptional regulator